MERIEYREAVFNVVQTVSCERTRVTDHANNYLHTHWEVVAKVNWQPALTAYTIPAPGGKPVATPGTLPGETDLALLSRLLQPRGQLRLIAGDSIILDCPVPLPGRVAEPNGKAVDSKFRYPCDVKGGPSIEAVGVPQMIGFRHWFVTLHIVADVRDTVWPKGDSNVNAVLSNLWVSNEDIDFQRRSVRRFAGRAILRADVMRSKEINANSLRDLFLFRCPDHYQRKVVSVSLSEDGTELEWMFEDTMRGYDLGFQSPILDIECFRTGSVTRGSPLKLLLDTIHGIANAGSGANFSVSGEIIGTGGSVTVPVGAFAAVAAAALDNLPKSYLHCRCDLTGDRNADLGFLTAVAMGICNHQITEDSDAGQLLSGSLEITFRQDIADKVYTSVEMSTQFTSAAVLNAAGTFLGTAIRQEYRNFAGITPALQASLDAAMQELIRRFHMDSRRLEIVVPPGAGGGGGMPRRAEPPPGSTLLVIASRQGDVIFAPHVAGQPPPDGPRNLNPPLRQGAFGVVPQAAPVAFPGGFIPPAPGSPDDPFGWKPTGAIPAGIEHLIVQTLLGQNQLPPPPPQLLTDS